MTKVYTLAMWGPLRSMQSWIKWFRFMEEASSALGAPLTHFGIEGAGLGTTNIRPIGKFTKIEAAIESCSVDWLCGYSLPKDFQTAVFDYNIYMSLCSSYVSISTKESFANPLLSDLNEWKRRVSTFCSTRKAMLFQMDESECPQMYVSGASPLESFRSIVVLKEFD